MELMKLPSEVDADWLAFDWTVGTESSVEKSMGYLGEVARILKESDVGLLVTGVPHYPQYTGKWSPKPHWELKKQAINYGFEYFDSYAALRSDIEGTEQKKYYWPKDPTHFNAAGNKLWAEVHLKALLERDGLLPKR